MSNVQISKDKQNNQESIEFQIYDWLEDHQADDCNSDDDEDDERPGVFIIHTFGRCDDGKSVYAKVTGYEPGFYILMPSKLQKKSDYELKEIAKKMENYFKGRDNKKVYYKFKHTLKEIRLFKLKKAEGFTNDKEFWFARLFFTNADGMKKYKSYLENNDVTIPSIPELATKGFRFKLYEANLPPMFRCFHVREISGCSWIETSKYSRIIEEDEKESRCDIEIVVDYRNLNPIKKDHNAPLRICSFDIECNSIDGEFPQAKRPGDCVIQIGATYTTIGTSKPYRQYIACLKETSAVEGTIVESFETERDLMLGYLNEINNNDCDIIVGYNTFFFDEKYMYDRCKNILHIEEDMAYMSKLKNFRCNFKEIKLASSALGENLLRYWDTPGRVHIDLMKDIQKTFNLPCYKLDYVASKFIRGEVMSYSVIGEDKFELVCKSVQDINVGDYIHLEVVKGFVSDEVGEKYMVFDIDLDKKKIVVKGDHFLEAELNTAKTGGIINWSQAKDDVGPKDIFRLQKGSPDDRAIVAKYCVKDCRLVNLLINKLEVITKNIEMANVCFVPLSYLFIRGQGIKLFSLCLREFRKQKYAFPVIKLNKLYKCLKCSNEYLNSWSCPNCSSKSREEIESEDSKYEGAIVFDPVPKVEYEALATKDYMSLYPSSIMHKNMSHETIVEDDEYDNLPGIKYYNAYFRENDGSIQYRRFAQIDNKLGVIPTILSDLLKERKAIKKQMGQEKDPFKYKILDAKQLAVKITANSLYGQLGAPTSPICKRDIAACTTSTGREMLLLAKKYDEELLPSIMNGLKYFYKTNQLDKVELLYDLELKAKNDHELKDSVKKYVTEDIGDLTFQPVIRYGDSVIGKTPLLLRDKITGNIFIKSIESLVKLVDYKPMLRDNSYDTKECSELSNLETWTEKGWTRVHRVIRHRLHQSKKLFRIATNSGIVVVTDDHSLITPEGKEIKPNELNVGARLLHSFPIINSHNNKINININQAYFLGVSVANKSLSGSYTNVSSIIELILNSSLEVRRAFWQGLTKLSKNYLTCNNDTFALGIYALGKSVGYNITVNTDNDSYIIHFNDTIPNDSVMSIEEWRDNEEYVYDLTTDNHHFHAGVGSMIVHNTDSIFSCYRFREKTVLVSKPRALEIWKKVIAFAKILIEPFFATKERILFNQVFEQYYSDDKIVDLRLPEPPKCQPEPTHHAIILPIEERIKQFIKEYMEESYIPWLWTLSELVEKDHTSMFDIKLTQWAEHQLGKIRLLAENMYENRKNELVKPILSYLSQYFINKYSIPSKNIVQELCDKLDFKNPDCFVFAKEIKIKPDRLLRLVKSLIENTIKEKWVYSGERKELGKIVDQYLTAITADNNTDDKNKFYHFITEFIGINRTLDSHTLADLLNKNLLNDQTMGLQFNEDGLNEHTKIFIEKYNKSNGKKTLEEIVEDFIERDLELSFSKYKDDHYKKVIDFVNNNMRYEDMSQMDSTKYIYYWIQPRWDFDSNFSKIYAIDIYEGGESIEDNRSLRYGMEMGKLSGELIKSHLPFPHDCEYEKTFWPFAILTKKRYVGNKYEFDPNKYKFDYNGIVLKRRDNSPIVKEVCGGIIDYLINHRDPQGAKNYTIKCLTDMFDNKYDIKYFLQSRSLKLKESYKDWKKIAHVYLADKIAKRDPGNAPQSGDRIEFAVIKVKAPTDGTKLLQADIIETPQFIKENNLEIDYLFYLTNQIMKPALQFLELVDPNAIKIFDEFIKKYSEPKVKKERKTPVKSTNIVNKVDIVNTNKKLDNKKYILEIRKLMDEINEFIERTVDPNIGSNVDLIKVPTIKTDDDEYTLEIKEIINEINKSLTSKKSSKNYEELFLNYNS